MFYAISPFHEDKSEVQMAVLSSLVVSATGGKMRMNDFMISKTDKNTRASAGIDEMSADEINKFAGVSNG